MTLGGTRVHRLGLQKASEGVSIHCLEHIVFGSVEYFGTISPILFNLLGDFVDDGLRQDHLSLSAWNSSL
jgi:hypothetical protein